MNRKLFALCMLASTVSFGQKRMDIEVVEDTVMLYSDTSYMVYCNQIDGIAEVSTPEGIVYVNCIQQAYSKAKYYKLAGFELISYMTKNKGFGFKINPKDVIKFTPNQPK